MTTTFPGRSRTAAAAFALGLGAALTFAGQALADPKVLAKVDGQPITDEDVADAMTDIGPGLPQKLEGAARQKYVLDYLVDLKLAAKKAEADKLTTSPEFERKLAYYREKLAMEQLLSSVGKAATTEEAERKAYDDAAKAEPPQQEIHARHILLPTEEEAKKALARVKGGEDFAKVATELSKDPSGNGGDLGWFTKDRMVPEFSDAAFKLKEGEISEPVKTQFGWHIIKIEGSRTKSFPPSSRSRTKPPASSPRRPSRRPYSSSTTRPKSRCSTPMASRCRRRRWPIRARWRPPAPISRKPPDLRLSLRESRPRCSLFCSGNAHGRSRPAVAAGAQDLSRPAADRRRSFCDNRGRRALFGANRRHDGVVRPPGGGRGRVHALEVPLGAGRLVP